MNVTVFAYLYLHNAFKFQYSKKFLWCNPSLTNSPNAKSLLNDCPFCLFNMEKLMARWLLPLGYFIFTCKFLNNGAYELLSRFVP